MNMKNTLKLTAYNPHLHGDQYIDGVVSCYQKSFAGDPWNEQWLCSVCGAQYGESAMLQDTQCPKCSGELKEYWPYDTVRSDFLKETLPPQPEEDRQPSCWIALFGSEVVGICWGYTIDADVLSRSLKLQEFPAVISAAYRADARIAYLDEVAVIPEFRKKKFDGTSIARHLVESVRKEFVELGATVEVARTLKNPPSVVYEWFMAAGFAELILYRDGSERVILGASYSELLSK
jgi:ribosomal protein S18 acetylase RimI-like enzyme